MCYYGQEENANMSELEKMKQDPRGMAQKAGWNIPENIMGNPQAMVMHLIRTGQVGGPKLQQALQMMRGMR